MYFLNPTYLVLNVCFLYFLIIVINCFHMTAVITIRMFKKKTKSFQTGLGKSISFMLKFMGRK